MPRIKQQDALQILSEKVKRFVAERDWEQFHSPKNLVMALSVECGELMEHFQWLEKEESHSLPLVKRQKIAKEMADVFIYLLRFSQVMKLDLVSEAAKKLEENRQKYPVSTAKGSSAKYNELRKPSRRTS